MADNTVLVEKINGIKVELDLVNEEIDKLTIIRDNLEQKIEEGVEILLSGEGRRTKTKIARVMTR